MRSESLVARYPFLFHMAEAGAWPSIKQRGLLSTSAALDLLSINAGRAQYESDYRHSKMTIGVGSAQIILRDQKPMPPNRLIQGLRDGLTPSEWYEFLNRKVFMWAQEERLLRLLNAKHYRHLEHDVLTIDTVSLLRVHYEAVWLCHMNSGNALPVAHMRGKNIFHRISEYAARTDGRPEKEVVEVVVDYSIPDIRDHVTLVRRMRGSEVLGSVPL